MRMGREWKRHPWDKDDALEDRGGIQTLAYPSCLQLPERDLSIQAGHSVALKLALPPCPCSSEKSIPGTSSD